jgi:outer membrane protein assembly factor BamB
VFFLSLVLLCGSTARAGDWPQFRGAGGLGSSDDDALPLQWGPEKNVRWKATLPGRGVSCPVVARGRVYVTACSGFEQSRLHVLCFDQATGKQLWERQFWATGTTLCHEKTNMAAPTPVTDGEHVYALFATGDLAGLDAAGNLQWYRSLSRDYPSITNNVGIAASPVLWRDVLIVPMQNVTQSFAAGLDKLTGRNRWMVERARDISWVTPLVLQHAGQAEVLFQGQDLTAHDAETGRKLWTYPGTGFSTLWSPVPGPDLVFTGGGQFAALRPGAGGAVPQLVWQTSKLRPLIATPVYYQGRVYAINSPNVLVCADGADGKVLWQQRLKEGTYWASPVAAAGRLYVVSEDGTTTVVQAGDKAKVLAQNALGGSMLATPAISGGALFLRSDAHLYCIGEKK